MNSAHSTFPCGESQNEVNRGERRDFSARLRFFGMTGNQGKGRKTITYKTLDKMRGGV